MSVSILILSEKIGEICNQCVIPGLKTAEVELHELKSDTHSSSTTDGDVTEALAGKEVESCVVEVFRKASLQPDNPLVEAAAGK
jgi:hypothetical protein